MFRRLLLLTGALLPLTAAAQSPFGFEYRPRVAPVLAAGDTLRQAWNGGLNSPQYSSIDLNGDGTNDLFVFERYTNRILTYLSVPAAGGGRRWQFAPDYASLFPAGLSNWVLLRDYDCDGRPDLWTDLNGGDVRIFRNVAGPGGRPSFQLTTGQLLFSFLGTTPYSANVHLNGADVPAIQDVDGDGKLDILAFDYLASTQVQYFHNVSASCGGLTFRYETQSWGGLTYCGNTCTDYATGGLSCRSTAPTRVNHTLGHSLLLRDLDNDGDQDLLLARDGCAELVGIRNTGTTTLAATNASSVLTSLPSGLGSISLVNFPGAYAVDATQDGKTDLLVSSSVFDNSDIISFRRNGLLFENTGTSAAPSYVRRTSGFLQEQMIDVSEGAASAFADIDGDGLKDMLVANLGDQYGAPLTSSDYRATLAYYRNVGTARQPVFSLVTNDYLGLSARNFTNIRPVFTDLNRDGALDLVFDAYNIGATLIFYYLNTAPAGAPIAFNTSQLNNLNNVGNTRFDTPCFTDVDGDGYQDLLLGTYSNNTGFTGSLSYYRRVPGQPVSDAFTLVNGDFGGFRTPDGLRPSYLSPAVADVDGDGTPDLLVADNSGTLHLVTNYRSQLNSPVFLERTDLQYNALLGQNEATRWGAGTNSRNHITLTDLDGDNAPELVVGTGAGGLLLYGTRNRVLSTRSQANSLPLQAYPNPAQQQLTIETPTATRVQLRDLLGRVVRQDEALLRRRELRVDDLAAGVYLLEATDATGRRGVQRVQVK